MSKIQSTEDSYCEKQITDADTNGNALLSELIAEKITDHKRKLSGRIQIKEEVKLYKREIENLRSLKIGGVHHMLKIKEEKDPSVQVDTIERLLAKIEKILRENVCYSASDVISREEFEELKDNLGILQSLKATITDVPATAEQKLQKINEFSQNIERLLSKVESVTIDIRDCQNGLIKQTSEAINFM